MMIAGVGGSTVVRGRRMAIPEAGPMPGSTPTSVPMKHPTNAQKRFCKERAVTKPWNR
jgi:hypothetical protein